MISVELFSAVTGINFKNGLGVDGYSDFHHMKKWNIHALAHACKKWANKYDECTIESNLSEARVWTRMMCADDDGVFFSADTEPDAIFKACQWILDGQKKGRF